MSKIEELSESDRKIIDDFISTYEKILREKGLSDEEIAERVYKKRDAIFAEIENNLDTGKIFSIQKILEKIARNTVDNRQFDPNRFEEEVILEFHYPRVLKLFKINLPKISLFKSSNFKKPSYKINNNHYNENNVNNNENNEVKTNNLYNQIVEYTIDSNKARKVVKKKYKNLKLMINLLIILLFLNVPVLIFLALALFRVDWIKNSCLDLVCNTIVLNDYIITNIRDIIIISNIVIFVLLVALIVIYKILISIYFNNIAVLMLVAKANMTYGQLEKYHKLMALLVFNNAMSIKYRSNDL